MLQHLAEYLWIPVFVGSTALSSSHIEIMKYIINFLNHQLNLQVNALLLQFFIIYMHTLLSLRQQLPSSFPQIPIPKDAKLLRIEFGKAFSQLNNAGKRVVVLIDGMDQILDLDSPTNFGWLPDQLSVNGTCKMIVSVNSQSEAGVAILKRGWNGLKIEALGQPERKLLVTQYLKLYAKTLTDSQLEK
jgi:hypothetical protein